MINIRIIKLMINNNSSYIFFKNNYSILHIIEEKNRFKIYDGEKSYNNNIGIIKKFKQAIEIDIYEFVFSDFAEKLFSNKKNITYFGKMKITLKNFNILKEFFKQLIKNN